VAVAFLTMAMPSAAAQDPSPSATPVATPTPVASPTASPSAEEIEAQRCADFISQQDAQSFFVSEGGPDLDPHGLDADRDGTACEGIVEVQVASAEFLAQAEAVSCSDFDFQEEAQAEWTRRGYTPANDPNGWDPDDDGIPCEDRPRRSGATAQPTGASSQTQTASPTPTSSTLPRTGTSSIEPMAISGMALLALGFLLMFLSSRRRRLAAASGDRSRTTELEDWYGW
jgi:LPXTG-motif cell wall-anchored protein